VDQNYRVNPDTGVLTTDSILTGATDVADTAYDRSIAGTAASTAFAVDGSTDKLYRLGGIDGSPSPNGGVLTEIGPLGVDLTKDMRFDISPTSGVAYISHFFNLFTMNLSTGALTPLATVSFNPSNGVALLGSSSVAFDSATATVLEDAGSLALTVVRSGVSNRPTTVSYATSSDTATAGSDYTATNGTVTFAAGETSHTIHIPILRDAVNDGGEKFSVVLGGVQSGELGTASTSTVTITQETTRPVVLALPLAARTFATISKNGLSAPFSVSEASRTTATLKLGTKVVGTVPAVTTTDAAIRRAKATLTPRGRNTIRTALAASRLHRVVLTLTLRTEDTSGNAKSTVVRVVVRA
jgi:hypothetical protein